MPITRTTIFRPLASLLLAATCTAHTAHAAEGSPRCETQMIFGSEPGRNGRMQLCSKLLEQVPALQAAVDRLNLLTMENAQTLLRVERFVATLGSTSRQLSAKQIDTLADNIAQRINSSARQGDAQLAAELTRLALEFGNTQTRSQLALQQPDTAEPTRQALQGEVGDAIARLDFNTANGLLDALLRIETTVVRMDKKLDVLAGTMTAGADRETLQKAIEARALGDQGQGQALARLVANGMSFSGWDLSGLHLANAQLAQLQAANAKLVLADLSGADLARAKLANSRLLALDAPGASFEGATLDESIGAYGVFTRARFVGASLKRVSWEMSDLREANFSGADLSGADFALADLRGADFSGALLDGAFFVGADLRGAKFDGAKLRDTDLAAALYDDELLARFASGACATVVETAASNYAYVRAPINGTDRHVFSRTLPIPRAADGGLSPCAIRIGRVWPRGSKLAPVFRAPNSGREFLALSSEFGYDRALLATGNRNDMVQQRYSRMLRELEERFASVKMPAGRHANGRLQHTLRQLKEATAVPRSPVWLTTDSMQLALMKHAGFRAGSELPEWRQAARIRMQTEYEIERLGAAGHLHDAWAPFFPATAPPEERPPEVVALYQRWIEQRVAALGSVWLTLRCSGERAPITLDRCDAANGGRFTQNESVDTVGPADTAQLPQGRWIRLPSVGSFANALLFPQPVADYAIAQQAQATNSNGSYVAEASALRHELELRIDRLEVAGQVVIWHVTPGKLQSRPFREVWPTGYRRHAFSE